MSTSGRINRIIEDINRLLPARVGSDRLQHIQGVRRVARDLSSRFGADPVRVDLAAVVHDLDRDTPVEELFTHIADWRIPVTAFERDHPKVLHGPVAAERLRREYGIDDRTVYDAVRHHTLGHPVFLDQEQPIGLILYVADFCDPRRDSPPENVRREVLQYRDIRAMASAVVSSSRDLFGALEEPTARMYARLSGDFRNDT